MKFWQIDSFTNKQFQGNPASIFVCKKEPSELEMQNIAMEMNQAETAFVTIGAEISIRFFTPKLEVDLCGHATLGAAHILWKYGFIQSESITFQSKSGPLIATKSLEGYTLDFPTEDAKNEPALISRVSDTLGLEVEYVGSIGTYYIATLPRDQLIYDFTPDFHNLSKVAKGGLILTAKDSSKKYDYICRCFFPNEGIPEDSVTGFAQGYLAPYWSEIFKKNKLKAYQASKRGGELFLEMKGKRVLISGNVVTVFEGKMLNI